MKKRHALIALGVVALLLAFEAVFIVDQTESAIVMQLGRPLDGVRKPGLHFKIPFVQNVLMFDARLLDYDAQPAEVLTKDKKAMVVDNYTKWRISNPLVFYRTVRTIPGAQARLDDIIYSELRVLLGRYTLIEIVSTKRAEIMDKVTEKSNELINRYGINVVDVRIKRTDLPPENERAIFGRMRTERERQAKQYRSEGREAAAKIRAESDRERTVILAKAKKEGEIQRGEGDAEATKIYAESLGQSPDFYSFQKSMEAYKKSFRDKTRMVLTPSSDFLKYMQ